MGNKIVSLKMSEKDIENLDRLVTILLPMTITNSMNRSDFIRMAIREKMDREECVEKRMGA